MSYGLKKPCVVCACACMRGCVCACVQHLVTRLQNRWWYETSGQTIGRNS